jgi:hypothetical protein
MPCRACAVAEVHRNFNLCAPDHPGLAPASPRSAVIVIAMQGQRMNTLWAAMLSAWLAAGQTTPPAAAPDRAEAPCLAGERASPAPAQDRPTGA